MPNKQKKDPKVFTPFVSSFKRNGSSALLTNMFGEHVVLNNAELKQYLSGKIKKGKLSESIYKQGFLSEMLDFDHLSGQWRSLNSHVCSAPMLHIFVMTARCNMHCVYCQAESAVALNDKKLDMSWTTAKKSIDFAFKTPASSFSIEFQGGEPLINWDVLKKSVSYIRKLEEKNKKKVNISIVSNFTLMTVEKAEFLLENEVSICTSLDGPECVHNKNRLSARDVSYKAVKKWLAYFNKRHENQQGKEYRVFKPSALLTVTKNSLGYAKEIVDEYVNAGLTGVYLRPVARIGCANDNWNSIGFSVGEYMSFYRKAVDYILELNKKGINVVEKTIVNFCSKIYKMNNGGNYDLNSPCGAGTGQVAYNYDGNLYTCDEGRMLAMQGDDIFKIGTVNDDYNKVMNCDVIKICKLASELNSQPTCARCAYMPYCGVCPVANYSIQGSVYGNNRVSDRCAINMATLDYIFELLKNKENEGIIRKWLLK